jgi:hypothetical protein
MAYGLIYGAYLVSVLGGLIVIGALYAWALEPSAEPHEPHDTHEGGGGEDGADREMKGAEQDQPEPEVTA